jgi:hypothetical protein
MKLRIFSVLIFLAIQSRPYAQTNTDNVLKDFFLSIQTGDTAKFVQHFISSSQLTTIIKLAMPENVFQDSHGKDSLVNIKQYREMLAGLLLNNIKSSADSLKIDLRSTIYYGCSYQIIREPQILFVSLSGKLYFSSTDRFFMIPIEEAIWMDEHWKITKMGSIMSVSKDSSIDKRPAKLSAFNSLNFEVKLTDIQAMPSSNQEPPPPPPPQPPKKKKK